jgi:hypothetical protein
MTQVEEEIMRFIFLVKATEESEAGTTPDQRFIDAVSKYSEEMVKAGVAVDLQLLRPSSQGFRVAYDNGNVGMVEGPFVESKELIAAYWAIDVASKAEAIAWAKKLPFENGFVEVRQAYTEQD